MLRSVAAVLDTAPDKDWDVGREMIGWGQVEWIVLLLLCEDDRGTCVSGEWAQGIFQSGDTFWLQSNV